MITGTALVRGHMMMFGLTVLRSVEYPSGGPNITAPPLGIRRKFCVRRNFGGTVCSSTTVRLGFEFWEAIHSHFPFHPKLGQPLHTPRLTAFGEVRTST